MFKFLVLCCWAISEAITELVNDGAAKSLKSTQRSVKELYKMLLLFFSFSLPREDAIKEKKICRTVLYISTFFRPDDDLCNPAVLYRPSSSQDHYATKGGREKRITFYCICILLKKFNEKK